MEGLKIKQYFTLVEHPQTNGHTESANKVIMEGIKKRFTDTKGEWADELDHVMWAYRTQLYSTMGETPFRLTFESEAVIPAEIGEPNPGVEFFDEQTNSVLLREDLDLVEERRDAATTREAVIK